MDGAGAPPRDLVAAAGSRVSIARWATLAFLFVAPPVTSQVAQLAQDFKPLTGQVVSQKGREYIVDLAQPDGLRVGDLLTVVGPGEVLEHAGTGQVIGWLEQPKAVLNVTEVGAQYSRTRLSNALGEIEPGDPVRRYINSKAVFSDQTADQSGQPMYSRLRHALPSLDWVGYGTGPDINAQKMDGVLVFELRENVLMVRDAQSLLFRSYSVSAR